MEMESKMESAIAILALLTNRTPFNWRLSGSEALKFFQQIIGGIECIHYNGNLFIADLDLQQDEGLFLQDLVW